MIAKYLNKIFYLFIFLAVCICVKQIGAQEFAVLHKGRFQPAESYAKNWFFDFYQDTSIHEKDRLFFHTTSSSPMEWLDDLQIRGYLPYQTAPLFFVKSDQVKETLQLPLTQSRFSYQDLYCALYLDPILSPKIVQQLLTYYFYKIHSQSTTLSTKHELKNFLPGLHVQLKKQQLIVKKIPSGSIQWPFLKEGWIAGEVDLSQSPTYLKTHKKTIEEITDLMFALYQFERLTGLNISVHTAYKKRLHELKEQQIAPKDIETKLELEFPLNKRLQAAGLLFPALPWKNHPHEWLPLNALLTLNYSAAKDSLVLVDNFTSFSDEHFNRLQKLYEQRVNHIDTFEQPFKEDFFSSLSEAYLPLSGTIYEQAFQKELKYPTVNQLKAEAFFSRYPLTIFLIGLYFCCCLLLSFSYFSEKYKKIAISFLWFTFLCHTFLLGLRCFILGRPPVSNMAETVLYVPWIAVFFSLMIPLFRKQQVALLAASTSAFLLLSILEWTKLNQNFDQLQAVLDSRFWLMTHVLMVVGSYGLFILSAVLGHFYLFLWLKKSIHPSLDRLLATLMLQTLYAGVTLLIIGTVLGGIWAAESWGRFWDWDPKESWAFISSCLYLIWIHAYRFHKIASFGLAIGTVSGFLAISFTWYGVNYILGTGLHSYGFGSGGEGFYYAYFAFEFLFILFALTIYRLRKIKLTST